MHPFIVEHLTSSNNNKKNVSKLPVSNSIIPILVRKQHASDEQLRPVTLFGAESVVQSVNAEGGTNQRLRPISGQSCHQSKVTSSLVRKGQAKRKTIHTFNTTEHHVERRQQLKPVVIRQITMSSCKFVDIRKHALKKGTQWLRFSGWRS